MANVFTLNDDGISTVAAAHLSAAAPVYRLTAQATIEDEIESIDKKGKKIDVLIPDAGDSKLLVEGGSTVSSDLDEGRVTLSMDQHFYRLQDYTAVDAQFRASKDLAGAVSQAFGGTLSRIGEDVDASILSLLKGVPFFVGNGGAVDTVAKATAGIPVLENNRGLGGLTPMAIFGPFDYQEVATISEFSNANTRGSDEVMRTGILGNVFDIDWIRSRAVSQPTKNFNNTHIAGTFEAGSPVINVTVTEGSLAMNVDGGGGTETMRVGDLFTVTGASGTNQFVVRENLLSGDFDEPTQTYTATGGAIAGVAFFPAAPASGFPDGNAVNMIASHRKNVLMTTGCLAAAVLPPTNVSTLTNQPGQMQSIFDPNSGIGLALTTYQRESSSLGAKISVDTFQGGALITPERAVIYYRLIA